MDFILDHQKALQAAAFLLTREGEMTRIRLLKLLYLADRASLEETGRTITGDQVVAMEHGPVLSTVYDWIKHSNQEWSSIVENEGKHGLRLVRDPGTGNLSRYDVRKLSEISDRYLELDEWEIVELTHQLPEWKKNDPGKSSKPIPLHDILEGLGKLYAEDEIVANIKAQAFRENAFRSVAD